MPNYLTLIQGTDQIAAKISFKGDDPETAAVKRWDRVAAS